MIGLVGDGKVTLPVARQMRRNYEDCITMHQMLSAYARLGKTETIIENGVRVMKCPPAYANGIWPGWSVGSRGRR